MKTDQLHSTLNPRPSAFLRLGLIASLCLAVSATAVAKKGGGGRPGGEDPPVEPPPFYYQINQIGDDSEERNRNYFRLFDVASDGTAVGQFWPLNNWGASYAVACLPDGSVLNLEALLIEAGEVSPETRIRTASNISENGLITLDVWDAAGFVHTGALQLNPDLSIEKFSLFSNPGGESAVNCDVTEGGEILIAGTDIDEVAGEAGALSFGNPATMFIWNPTAETLITVPGQAQGGIGGWIDSKISDFPAALLEGTLYEYTTGVSWTTPDPGTTVTYHDVSADGTVVATMRGQSARKNRLGPVMLARWSPGFEAWEPIVESSANEVLVNSTGEIAWSRSGNLFVYHDLYGFLAVEDLLDPANSSPWNGGETVTLRGFSNALPDDPYGGVIVARLGDGNNGPHVVLVPIPIP